MTAIEPLDEMRTELEAALPDVHAVAGSAEAIPLPDASADVVTSAQAFHWFDHDEALPEIARVLRPGGRLALVWNSRDDRDPWMARLSEIIGNETVQEWDVIPVIEESGRFGRVERAQFSLEQVLDRDGLLDLVLSRSYLAKLPPAEREPVLAAVGPAVRRDRRHRRCAPPVRHRVLPRRAALGVEFWCTASTLLPSGPSRKAA